MFLGYSIAQKLFINVSGCEIDFNLKTSGKFFFQVFALVSQVKLEKKTDMAG